MPAPRRFSEERLRQAALELVDEHGLAALTMRRLAGVLGTGPMTIYNYLDGRRGLERLIVEALLEAAQPDGAPEPDWRREVGRVAEGLWQSARTHPHAVPLLATFPLVELGRSGRGYVERLLEALGRGGLSGAELLAAFRAVSGYVIGSVASIADPLLAPDDGVPGLREVSTSQFPRLAEIAAASGADPDAAFRAGLATVLAGIKDADGPDDAPA